jgi:hypothetical protein
MIYRKRNTNEPPSELEKEQPRSANAGPVQSEKDAGRCNSAHGTGHLEAEAGRRYRVRPASYRSPLPTAADWDGQIPSRDCLEVTRLSDGKTFVVVRERGWHHTDEYAAPRFIAWEFVESGFDIGFDDVCELVMSVGCDVTFEELHRIIASGTSYD